MGSWSDTSSDAKAKVTKKPTSNYRVRFRHGVYPNAEGQATRAEIKKYDYFFSGGQTWVGTSGNVVDFIDESAQVAADLGSVSHTAPNTTPRRPSKRLIRTRTAEKIPQAASRSSFQASEISIRPATHAAVSYTFSSTAPSTASSSPRQASFQHRRHTSPATSSISSHDDNSLLDWQYDASTSTRALQSTHTSRVPWPLSDPLEAQLFRMFVDSFAPRWDTTSSHGVFEKVVPQLALTNSMLLNAVLMMGSQVACQADPSFPVKPYLYHDRVLQGLIPYLADHGRIQDEATLVAAMLLRGFEEFHAGTRGQCHLSTYELFHGPDGFLFNMSSPVVESCFMVHVNFEIYHGLLNRPTLRVDYRHYILPTLLSPSDDVAWGNRLVWICAQILQWVQSESGSLAEWQELKNAVDTWESERPSSFSPFFYREAEPTEGRYFPEACFPNLCHADANQQLSICRMALLLSCPEPSGNSAFEIENTRGAEVARWLKEMVAVARCNPHATTTPFIAAHAMHQFAVYLRDPQDQSSIMDFLEEVEIVSGWPTELTRQCLRVEWGWSTQDNAEQSNEDCR